MPFAVKSALKTLLHQVAPGWSAEFFDRRRREHIARLEAGMGLPELTARYLGAHEAVVRRGPFAGARYIAEATGSVLVPKLVGAYEAELAPALEALLARGYDTVIDIGSAEGYYAVGAAVRLPAATVYAYDTSSHARALCRKLGDANNVGDRLRIGGEASGETMARDAQGRTLVICDCDGCEAGLMDPTAAPVLRRCDVVLETHDFLVPGVEKLLTERFAPTHDVQIIRQAARTPADYTELAAFSPDEQRTLLDECRPAEQSWLVMTVR